MNQWSLPGGKVRLNETLLDAAFRELKEETNLNKTDLNKIYSPILSTDSISVENNTHYVISTICVSIRHNSLSKIEALDDASEFRLFYLDEIKDLHDKKESVGNILELINCFDKFKS